LTLRRQPFCTARFRAFSFRQCIEGHSFFLAGISTEPVPLVRLKWRNKRRHTKCKTPCCSTCPEQSSGRTKVGAIDLVEACSPPRAGEGESHRTRAFTPSPGSQGKRVPLRVFFASDRKCYLADNLSRQVSNFAPAVAHTFSCMKGKGALVQFCAAANAAGVHCPLKSLEFRVPGDMALWLQSIPSDRRTKGKWKDSKE
jgi:hypothetical protein